MQAVVITPGRTGSQLIVTNLRNQGIHTVHSHDPFWEPGNSNWICFLSFRRDLFASIASTLVGVRTEEYTVYTNKKLIVSKSAKLNLKIVFGFTNASIMR